jgi:hypothetical protein
VRRSRVAVAAVLSLLGVGEIEAQVTTQRNFAFGTIISGATTSVLSTSASAAQWRIHLNVSLAGFQLTLPTALTGPGTAIPLTFSATDGRYRVNNSNPAGGTTFNPQNFVTPIAGPNSDIFVWLGGSVSPPLNQTPGSYSATVVLTASGLL